MMKGPRPMQCACSPSSIMPRTVTFNPMRCRGRRAAIDHLAFMCLAVCVCAARGLAGTTSEVIMLPGPSAGDNFGKSVAGGSDVNADGFSDVAVGAPFADSSSNAKGSAVVYLGGTTFFNTTADHVLFGQSADEQFGISVAADMDLNNDGFGDVAVGARFSDLSANDAGAVFIYFGGPQFGVTSPLILLGQASDDWFGQSVRPAGDVNGDGFDDLIIGAPYNDAAANAAGRAYIYFGGPSMDNIADVILNGAATSNSHFGWSVSGAGDVNNDGFDDVIIGARLHGTGPNQGRGRAYIFFGGNPMNTVADLIIEGEAAHDWFGESVASAGDFNGDGFDDVIVGAIFADPPSGSAAGKAYIYFGGNPMNAVADVVFAGPQADAQLGNAVAGAGDVNADGFDDVVIGAHFANGPAGANTGQAFVFFGGPAPDNIADIAISGTSADDQCGESVAGAGAVASGNGTAFVVGAHFSDVAGNGSGQAFVARLPTGSACPADLNADATVNVLDLLGVINNWGVCTAPCPPACNADITGDCVVNVGDLLGVINAWGDCE